MNTFDIGDLVRIDDDLGPAMSHFSSGCDAIVVGACTQTSEQYTLYIEGKGESSWYLGKQLTLIKRDQTSLLRKWREDAERERKEKSDLDWIFRNGNSVAENPVGATLQALADCFDFGNLWGLRGEGIDFYRNSQFVLEVAKPFLLSGDKEGWLTHCAFIKARNQTT